jgi:hypothetical protein
MGRITGTSGKSTAQFVTPVRARAVARWQPHELEVIRQAVEDGLDLDQTHALLPYRSYHSVKDRYYRSRGWAPTPDGEEDEGKVSQSLYEARRQKDAREGSARLYQALIDAGLWVPLEQKKAG